MRIKVNIPRLDTFLRIGLLLLLLKTLLSYSTLVPYTNQMDNILSLLGAGCLVVSILKRGFTIKVLSVYASIV